MITLVRFAGVALLAMGTLMTASPAAADDPPVVTTLANQRVELLPPGQLCWNLFRTTLPAGVRVPQSGYLIAPLAATYITEGEVRGEYAGGPARTLRAGDGGFVGAGNWFAGHNTGTATATSLSFALTCGQYPPAGTPGAAQLGNTGVLAGFDPGQRPHALTLRTGSSGAGSQGPVVSHTGPVAYHILEGETAISMKDGVKLYRQGDLFAIPAGIPYQYTNIGTGRNRSLYVFLTPADAVVTQLHPDMRLPQHGPSALPRTGNDDLATFGPLAALAGALLLAAGARLRRATE